MLAGNIEDGQSVPILEVPLDVREIIQQAGANGKTFRCWGKDFAAVYTIEHRATGCEHVIILEVPEKL